jgi:hypothetical protein
MGTRVLISAGWYKSDRKSGGQAGHKGKTLRQTATPDHVISHYPEVCDACGAALSAIMAENTVARQVVDLPAPPPPEVTEHRVHLCRCGQCDAVTRGVFPEGVVGPVQYGVLPSCWPGLNKVCQSHENADQYASPERLPLSS